MSGTSGRDSAPGAMSDAMSDAAALKRAALQMAIEYHRGTSQHPNARGPASPERVTATAETFLSFIGDVVDRAGVELPEPRDT